VLCLRSDLGCGIGRVPALAGALFGFGRCVGIELLRGLYDVCAEASAALPAPAHDRADGGRQSALMFAAADFLQPIDTTDSAAAVERRVQWTRSAAPSSSPLSADADADTNGAGDNKARATVPDAAAVVGSSSAASRRWSWWSDSSVAVVFVNATCFEAAIMAAIEQRARHLPTGALLISTTHALRPDSKGAPYWEVPLSVPHLSAYRSTAHVHRRTAAACAEADCAFCSSKRD
jgi:hypothetical protein